MDMLSIRQHRERSEESNQKAKQRQGDRKYERQGSYNEKTLYTPLNQLIYVKHLEQCLAVSINKAKCWFFAKNPNIGSSDKNFKSSGKMNQEKETA